MFYSKGLLSDHEGTGRAFTIPATGTYCFECWGASGSDCTWKSYESSTTATLQKAGRGGYTKGIISFTSTATFYIYVGSAPATSSLLGGWNGGGDGVSTGSQTGYAGGGSTDIRTTSGAWNNATSLNSRIMVAAGGGGSGHYDDSPGCGYGGDGGGINGLDGLTTMSGWEGAFVGTGATQTEGGRTGHGNNGNSSYVSYANSINSQKLNDGGFGYGGKHNGTSIQEYGGCAGGSGYWGGGAGFRGHGGGGGGSSFISGHPGCVAITSSTSRSPRSGSDGSVTKATHYSGYVFTSTVIKAGNESSMPQTTLFETTDTETGHSGSGFARITQISVD